MSQQWYVQTAQGKTGPFTPTMLRQLAQTGKITPESLVSLDNRNWSPAARVQGLTFADARETPNPSLSPTSPSSASSASPSPVSPPSDSSSSGSDIKLTAAEAALLYPDAKNSEEDLPAMSSAEGLPLRFGLSFLLGAAAAGIVTTLVRLLWRFGVIDLGTLSLSLAVRVGLPAIAFGATFAFIFWACAQEVSEPPKITDDMSDDEIARLLKRH